MMSMIIKNIKKFWPHCIVVTCTGISAHHQLLHVDPGLYIGWYKSTDKIKVQITNQASNYGKGELICMDSKKRRY